MVPRHFISPILFLLLLATFSAEVSAGRFFKKLRLGSSRQDTAGQSSSSAPPPPPPPEQPRPFPQGKKTQPPIQPITITRRLELWYRPGDRLLAIEVKGELGGTEPPYIVEGPPSGEGCDPSENTPETLNTVDDKRMKPTDLRKHNVRLIQEELVNARHAMYDDSGKYKSGNPYVAGIQELLDSMIHVLDSDRNPDGDAKFKSAVERYEDISKYVGCLPEDWRRYPLSTFTFRLENPSVIEVFDSRSCDKKNKCHDQTVEFSGQGRVGLSPPVIYRVCACAVLKD